jgi:hypothetical protein
MQPPRPRISQKVLLELAEKLHQDDPIAQSHLKIHPLLKLYQKWAALVIGDAWILMVAVAPILLFLMLFGPKFNFTGQWVIAAAWLVGGSFIVGGLLPITIWLDQFIRGDRPATAPLLAGIAILTSTIGGIFVIWQGMNESVPPLMIVGVSTLLGVLFIVWGVYRLITERQTNIVFRLLFLIAAFCFSVGLVSNMITLKHETLAIAPENYRALQALNGVLSPIGWSAFIISNLSSVATKNIHWNKRTSLQLGLLGVLLIILLLLLFAR